MAKEIQTRTFYFALQVIHLHPLLHRNDTSKILAKQLLRSATSIGANLEEADAARTKREFIHKVMIARKEARETLYWLRLLREAKLLTDRDDLIEEAQQIVSILTAISRNAESTDSRKLSHAGKS
jgi:four helix bundle protein